MVIENVNISKNIDNTFMIRVFVDDEDEKVEVILDKVMIEDFIIQREEAVEVSSTETLTKKPIEEFHVNLTGTALYETDDENGNVGRIIKYPKNND